MRNHNHTIEMRAADITDRIMQEREQKARMKGDIFNVFEEYHKIYDTVLMELLSERREDNMHGKSRVFKFKCRKGKREK